MDTSKEYILQCEKADEIQKQWKPQRGDWYSEFSYSPNPKERNKYIRTEKRITGVLGNGGGEGEYESYKSDMVGRDGYVWLPRIDQLIELLPLEAIIMPGTSTSRAEDVIEKQSIEKQTEGLVQLCWEHILDNENKYNSFEKLWLSIFMIIRYGKKWNGKEWTNG